MVMPVLPLGACFDAAEHAGLYVAFIQTDLGIRRQQVHLAGIPGHATTSRRGASAVCVAAVYVEFQASDE
jgi:hypothetical protein